MSEARIKNFKKVFNINVNKKDIYFFNEVYIVKEIEEIKIFDTRDEGIPEVIKINSLYLNEFFEGITNEYREIKNQGDYNKFISYNQDNNTLYKRINAKGLIVEDEIELNKEIINAIKTIISTKKEVFSSLEGKGYKGENKTFDINTPERIIETYNIGNFDILLEDNEELDITVSYDSTIDLKTIEDIIKNELKNVARDIVEDDETYYIDMDLTILKDKNKKGYVSYLPLNSNEGGAAFYKKENNNLIREDFLFFEWNKQLKEEKMNNTK